MAETRIVSDLVSQTSGVFLALLLYRLLSPVNKTKAVLMAALFLVSVPLSLSIALNDLAARVLFEGPAFLSSFSRAQLDGLARIFVGLHIQGVFAVEIFWGLWLIPLGSLVFKSRVIPRALGVTLIAAGLAYALHSLFSLLLPGRQPALYQSVTMAARAAGELPLIFWLLVKGARAVPRSEGPSSTWNPSMIRDHSSRPT